MLHTLHVCALVIRLVNSAHVGAATLLASEQQAARVLRRSGIEVTWRDCSSARCPEELTAGEYWMHVALWKAANASEDALAFAAGDVAGVYYPMVRQMAENYLLDEAPILGAALAHEIAHLLGMRHSPDGVMSARFDRSRMVAMSQGELNLPKLAGAAPRRPETGPRTRSRTERYRATHLPPAGSGPWRN